MRLATDSNYTYTHTVNTEDVQQLFSKASGMDLAPLFHLYLRTTRQVVDRKGITVVSATLPLIDARVFYLKRVIYE
jgi:hypothetical protein